MPKNRIINFRVTSNQYESILNNKEAHGYPTITSYLISLALEKNILVDTKIMENNKMIKEILNLLKNGK